MTPLSPKHRFLQDKDLAKAHAAMMASVQFEKASDLALLQVGFNLPVANKVEEMETMAAANHYRMQGAYLFLGVLLTLGDPIAENAPPPNTGLDYNVK